MGELPLEAIKQLPVKKRRTVRALARNSNIPKSTLQDHIKRGNLERHSNSIKPTLTKNNELRRLQYCLAHIEPETIETDPLFKGNYNVIHVDEKWFNISEVNQRMILVPGESPLVELANPNVSLQRLCFFVLLQDLGFILKLTNVCLTGRLEYGH